MGCDGCVKFGILRQGYGCRRERPQTIDRGPQTSHCDLRSLNEFEHETALQV
jgi:hypothetical protein